MSAWELNDVEQGLRTKLVTLSGITRVFNSMRAARGATSPFVVFQFIRGPGDVRGQGAGNRIMSRPQYQIEVVTEGPPTDASEAMVTAINNGIDGATFTSGAFTITGTRLDPVSRRTPGIAAEQFFIHRGGLYQFWVS